MSPRQRQATSQTAGSYVGAGVYPRDLVPFARPGDYVRLEPDGDVYQVDILVPQPGVRAFDSDDSNGVSLTANGTNEDNEPTELEQPTGWLAQYRPVHLGTDLDDDVRATIDLGGRQAPIYTNKNGRGEWEQETFTAIGNDESGTVAGEAFNSNLTELYVHEDEVPFFTFEETAGNTPTVSDLRFAGFQYRLVEASSPNGAHVEPVPTERVRE